ncbi:hypothetical protein HT90_24835 [Salmonella enterica subsp. enterica serovar Carmel]|uniref:hypothetical protein n=1 Tax=Salmonella bongori TaxID=54736 RepID=UPI00138823BB|nr:hypothetical protein [Salmonella bongori]EBV5831563.1 hypothetical protein [Salmonella enterica subsp. enterica serovar Carmel]ECN0519208.1 hypothetical protein [Salmonella enterica subsp. enterica serovar Montevideo]EEG2587614.1 hypothetical protein [Salmonella enterica]MBA2166633.1 hypothetical protein [Salmonella bongori serovar 48:z81:-]
MTAINIPDIYGRNYLINFDTVKYIEISDKEESGDLIIAFTDRAKKVIPVGLDREGAVEMFSRISYLTGSTDVTGRDRVWR